MRTSETGFLDRSIVVNGVEFPYVVYVPRDFDRGRSWPVILFLHGSGERGNDGLRATQIGLGAAIRAQSPFDRVGTPDEVAAAVAWLASADSLWASGTVIDVNGASYLR